MCMEAHLCFDMNIHTITRIQRRNVMTTREQQTIVAVFSTEERARAAIRDLHEAGFTDDQIGFVHRNNNETIPETAEEHAEDQATTERGAAAGGVTGGVVGGLLGAAAALFIPGVGPVVAGGILGATLGGIVIGAAAGGLIGALTHLGVPEEHAQYYNQELEAGRIIVTVHPNAANAQEALDIVRRNGAYDAVNRADQAYASGEAALPGEGANRAAYDPSLGSPTSYDTDPNLQTHPSQLDEGTGRYGTPDPNQGQYGNQEIRPNSTVMPNERDLSATDAEIARDRNPNTGEKY
jgi:hypothetical protein